MCVCFPPEHTGDGSVMGKEEQVRFSKQTFPVLQPCELFHFAVKESYWDDLVPSELMEKQVSEFQAVLIASHPM